MVYGVRVAVCLLLYYAVQLNASAVFGKAPQHSTGVGGAGSFCWRLENESHSQPQPRTGGWEVDIVVVAVVVVVVVVVVATAAAAAAAGGWLLCRWVCWWYVVVVHYYISLHVHR